MQKFESKEKIAEVIRSEMARKNISAKELAALLNVSQNTMTAIRRGNTSYERMVQTMNLIDNWEK